ncbi:MAG: cupin domain-containing protein [Gaiellaceae bacterium]
MQHLIHWDEVEPARREAGHIGGSWRDLGTAAGTRGVGVKLIEVDPGKWSTPAHVEGAEEEIFFVLAGSGLSWQEDGRGAAAYVVRAGDCLVHLAEAEAHTLCAGPDGLRVLAYGQRVPHGNTVLPRAGVAWMSPGFVDVTVVGEGRHPFLREAEAGEPEVGEPEVGEPVERPPSIVNLEDVPAEAYDRPGYAGLERDLARAAGSVATGLRHVVLEPGCLSTVPHCHSARGRCSSARTSIRCEREASSPGRPARASPTRSAPARAGSPTSPTARASRTTSPTTRARARSTSAASAS